MDKSVKAIGSGLLGLVRQTIKLNN